MSSRIGLVGVCCAMLAVTAGCGYLAPVIPPTGIGFTSYKAPLSTEPGGQTVATKSGEGSVICVLGLFSFGDCSLHEAAEEGNLRTIKYCDFSYLNILGGLFQQFTVIAHGD